jgi:ferredoxin
LEAESDVLYDTGSAPARCLLDVVLTVTETGRCCTASVRLRSQAHRRMKTAMPYVICEPCIGTKDASCVEVCPVDCIHSTDEDEQYYINPDECIDCGACEPVCPVTAIFPLDAVPPEWHEYIEKNAAWYAQR